MDPKFEAIELEGDSCIRIARDHCALFQDDHSWHYHPECEINYIISGEGTCFVGDHVQHYAPGELVLFGPNLPHCYINDDDDRSDPNRNQWIVLQFLPDCLGPDFLNSPDAVALQQLFDQSRRGLRFDEEQSAEIIETLQKLPQCKGLARLSLFVHLLDLFCQQQAEALTSEFYVMDTNDFHGGRMGKVIDYVRANLAEDIKQSDVADLVHMTPQGFSRFFRATTGRTFVSFVNVMRIMEACRLLVSTDRDIIDVAFACGYANLSNFNRRFAELKQTTPREYRNQQGKLT